MPPSPGSPPHSMHTDAPGLPVPGELLAGKYRVERVLGVGGMGVVVAARHLELDERVAVKFLLPHVPPHGEPVARFLREARAAIKIKSEHVVRVFDVGRLDNGAPYIVMEYLEGSDLSHLLDERGTLTVEQAVTYVLQACEAIAAAHALGVIHRDLKPANLFLTASPDGTPCVKVLDFGISKIAESGESGVPSSGLTSTTTIMGTPCFMSPEQLRSTRDVDGRTDIWSLGAILYALLAGKPPYEGESNADVSAKIIRDDPPPLRTLRSDVSEAMEALVQRCLEKDPRKRFVDVADLARALGELGSDDAKRAAVRVAKVATAVGPTLKSSPFNPGVGDGSARPESARRPLEVVSASSSKENATRTASSWGETNREEKKTRIVPLGALVLAASVVAAAVAVGIVKLGSAPANPGSNANANAPAVTMANTYAPPANVAATPTSIAAASASATSIASIPSAATVAPPPNAKSKLAPSASAKASAAAPSAKPGGLFDDRE